MESGLILLLGLGCGPPVARRARGKRQEVIGGLLALEGQEKPYRHDVVRNKVRNMKTKPPESGPG